MGAHSTLWSAQYCSRILFSSFAPGCAGPTRPVACDPAERFARARPLGLGAAGRESCAQPSWLLGWLGLLCSHSGRPGRARQLLRRCHHLYVPAGWTSGGAWPGGSLDWRFVGWAASPLLLGVARPLVAVVTSKVSCSSWALLSQLGWAGVAKRLYTCQRITCALLAAGSGLQPAGEWQPGAARACQRFIRGA